MEKLKIAVNNNTSECFSTERETVDINNTNFTDVSAAVISVEDAVSGTLDTIEQTGFGIPVFVAVCCEEELPAEVLPRVTGRMATEELTTLMPWAVKCGVTLLHIFNEATKERR